MVIVQFHGRLVRQYGACVVDSLGLGITCLISLYYVYTDKNLRVVLTLLWFRGFYNSQCIVSAAIWTWLQNFLLFIRTDDDYQNR